MIRITLQATSLLLVLSCNNYNLVQSSGGGTQTDIVQQSTDPTRPSEDGEGVPGYLVNPEAIAFNRQSSTILVAGGQGSIAGSAAMSVLKIVALTIDGIDASKVRKIDDDRYYVDGTILGTYQPASNGSFQFTIDGRYDTVVLRVAQTSGDAAILVTPERSEPTLAVKDFRTSYAGAVTFDTVYLKKTYPKTVQVDAPAAYADKASCNQALYYWSNVADVCVTSLTLAKLDYCWPTPNQDQLLALIEKVDEGGESQKEEIADFKTMVDGGYTLDQCYFADSLKETVVLEFLPGAQGGEDASPIVELEAEDFAKYLGN